MKVKTNLKAGVDCASLPDDASRTQCETLSASQYTKYLEDAWTAQAEQAAQFAEINKSIIANFRS